MQNSLLFNALCNYIALLHLYMTQLSDHILLNCEILLHLVSLLGKLSLLMKLNRDGIASLYDWEPTPSSLFPLRGLYDPRKSPERDT